MTTLEDYDGDGKRKIDYEPWGELGPGVTDANDGATVEYVVRQSLILHPAAMQKPILVRLAEPLRTAISSTPLKQLLVPNHNSVFHQSFNKFSSLLSTFISSILSCSTKHLLPLLLFNQIKKKKKKWKFLLYHATIG